MAACYFTKIDLLHWKIGLRLMLSHGDIFFPPNYLPKLVIATLPSQLEEVAYGTLPHIRWPSFRLQLWCGAEPDQFCTQLEQSNSPTNNHWFLVAEELYLLKIRPGGGFKLFHRQFSVSRGFSELIEITASFLYRDQYASLEYNFTSGAKDFSSLLGLISITKS